MLVGLLDLDDFVSWLLGFTSSLTCLGIWFDSCEFNVPSISGMLGALIYEEIRGGTVSYTRGIIRGKGEKVY